MSLGFPLDDGIELTEIEMLTAKQCIGDDGAVPGGKAELRFRNPVAVASGIEDEDAIFARAVPCQRKIAFQHRLADGVQLDAVLKRM